MGFLVTQIIVFLILAFLLGLLIGWLVWRRPAADCAPIQAELDTARNTIRALERKVASIEGARTAHFPVPAAEAGPTETAPEAGDEPEDVLEEGEPGQISDLGPIGGPAAAAFIDDATPLAPSPIPMAEDASGDSPAYDDLKRISGIGPTIERQLAEMGVTTYRQIAHFTDEDIERVGEHIDFFADRIRREGWVVQAAALHRETYGTAP